MKRTRSPEPSSECDLVIDDQDDYKERPTKMVRGVRLVEEQMDLSCGWNKCKKTFKNFKMYWDHVNSHVLAFENNDEQGNLECLWTNCVAAVGTVMELIKHVNFHAYHLKLVNIGQNMLTRVKLPKCTKSEVFIIPALMSDYSCDWDDCDRYFITINDFLNHIRLHVNSHPKYCKKGEFIECKWAGCKLKFSSQYKLSDHLRSHTKERVVACPTCGAMFVTKTKFCDHRKRQMPPECQNYSCSKCSKFFPTKRLLRDHERSHENHYKCSMCDMTCAKLSNLAKHIRFRHLKERPFKCYLCEHTCVTKYLLDEHLTTHCADKLMACEECDFRCRSLVGLDRHYQKLHGAGWSQTYECHFCREKFSRGNYLTQHLMKKHDLRLPSGHSRLKYREDSDGIFRLQTVRYDSLKVKKEMLQTATRPISDSVKYDLKKDSSCNMPSYILMSSETGEENVACATDKNVLITINDVDGMGNLVHSETIESQEIVCVPPLSTGDNTEIKLLAENLE